MLDPKNLKELSLINPIRPVLDIICCWAVIVASLCLCHISLFFLPITMVIIATRLHALIVLMHDGAHRLLNKNYLINDLLSNIFCSFPLQLSTTAYRLSHNLHHAHTQTFKDPNYVIMRREDQWDFPKPKRDVRILLFKDLFLLTIKDHMIILKEWQIIPNYNKVGRIEQITFPLFVIGLLSITAIYGLWADFFIFQISALLINPIARIRAMSEHIHVEAQDQSKISKLRETPTINASFLERFFFAPYNTCRHLEHHIYPSIPYYNLEKAHSLISQTPLYKQHCQYELDGYILGRRNSLTEVLTTGVLPLEQKLKKPA